MAARRGRKTRKASRISDIPEATPAAPGQSGGLYRPLSDDDLKAIFQTALDLLDHLGMGDVPQALGKQAVAKGARWNKEGRLCFSPDMVQAMIAGAAKSLTLHGRDPSRTIKVGGRQVHFGTGGAAVQTLDLKSGLYRPSTLRDLYDFTRLQDRLTNVSWFTRCCVATDVPDNLDLDVNTAYALLRGTTKPVATSFFLAEHVAPVVEMFDMAEGQTGAFARHPFCTAHISPIISPMKYGEDAFDVMLACMKHNMPLSCITAAQSGATAPATLAGFLAQSLAETLAALIMVNVFEPGYPMIFSNWPFVIDLRTGSFSGSGGEISVMNAASAQLSNWLGLPSGVAAAMADAKAVDAQMGAEKALSTLAAGLAGGNMTYESSGMMASLLGVSFEAFVLDDEMLSHVYRILRGIEVSEETLAFGPICRAVRGEGHFLGRNHTLAAMQRDYFYPALADRDAPVTWEEQGARDISDKARERAKQLLLEPDPEYISTDADKSIRKNFNILLN